MSKTHSGAVPARIARLLRRMTLAEKIGQMTMISLGGPPTGPVANAADLDTVRRAEAGSVLNLVGRTRIDELRRIAREESRLGLPILVGLDVLHGYRTIFPVPLGEASAFDPALWRATAAAAAREALAEGIDLTFAPMLDVARDPRWGRIVEGPGEDPWLAVRFAGAKVEGFQGASLDEASLAATAKHFCAYGAVTAGRDYATVDLSDRSLEEVYLPPFRAAVAAGVAAIMPAFVDLTGLPMTANRTLLVNRLRRRWGFDGVVVSDWTAIAELVRHGVAADEAEAAALALLAGVDIDMVGGTYRRGLPVALERGLVDETAIDAAVARVLVLKERLGLFETDRPRPGPRDSLDLATDAAARSAVLLKNTGGLLPLGSVTSLALIGPFAGSGLDAIGPWSGCGEPDEAVTLAAALRDAVPGCRITAVGGAEPTGPGVTDLDAAVEAARAAEIVLLCLGEPARLSGEAASRVDPGITGGQETLARAVLAVGRPTVVILTCGRPLIAPWLFEAADSVLVAWFPGSRGGPAIADLLTGRREPTGRLPVTWPRHVGQIPLHYGQRTGGRPFDPANVFTSRYVDMPNAPQFPFGAGQGYARLRLVGLTVPDRRLHSGDRVEVVVEVANDGDRDGTAVLFLFVHARVALPSRPGLELRAVEHRRVAAGSTVQVTVTVDVAALGSMDETRNPSPEPGWYDIRAGFDADPAGHLVAALEILGFDGAAPS